MRRKTGQRSVSANKMPLFLVGFGLFWTLFAAVFFFIGLGDGGTPFLLFSGLFILIGLAIMGYGGLTFYTRYRVGRPEILISSREMQVGDTFDVSVHHSFRSAVHTEYIRLSLIFRETATYQQGTDTRTVTHDHIIDEFEEIAGHYAAGSPLQINYQMQIPPDGMHTLVVRRNKLQWFVRLAIGVPRLPDFKEEIALTVRAAWVDPSFQ